MTTHRTNSPTVTASRRDRWNHYGLMGSCAFFLRRFDAKTFATLPPDAQDLFVNTIEPAVEALYKILSDTAPGTKVPRS